jgi:outer membrane protein assembly factor BamB
MRYRLALFVVVLFLRISTVFAEQSLDWPQFRGPNASGIAEEQTPPVEVGPEKNVQWKVEVPGGLSSPIVAGDLLIVTAFDNDKLYTIAYRRADGSEAWRAEAPAQEIEQYNKVYGSPAASTSATDGTHIVSYFGSCGLYCYDLAGKELWRHEMPAANTLAGFGSGVSPIVADGTVILLHDESKDPKILALDVETGAVKWEKKRESKSSFCTPTVWKTEKGSQVVAPGYGRMIGYNIANGDEAWFVEGMPSSCCTTPVTADGNLFFAGWSPGDPDDKDFQFPTFDSVLKDNDKDKDGAFSKSEAQGTQMQDIFDNNDTNKDGNITRDEWDALVKYASASRNSAFALKPGGTGNVTESAMLWKQTKGLPYVPSAILYRGQYIMLKDGGMLTAYDASTGKQLYQKRLAATGSYYASPVAAHGNIYLTSLEDGKITVLEGGTKPAKVIVENPPLGERTAATPAIAGNTLYVRTAKHLYAFAAKDGG